MNVFLSVLVSVHGMWTLNEELDRPAPDMDICLERADFGNEYMELIGAEKEYFFYCVSK